MSLHKLFEVEVVIMGEQVIKFIIYTITVVQDVNPCLTYVLLYRCERREINYVS